MKKSCRAIAICLIFTTMFTFNLKPKKTDAFALTMGTMALIGLGILIAGGVTIYATDPDMLEDIGATAYDKMSGFYDITLGEHGWIATAKNKVMGEVVEGVIKEAFSNPMTIDNYDDFPYTAEIRKDFYYGEFTSPSNPIFIEIFNTNNVQIGGSKSFPYPANTTFKISTANINPPRLNIVGALDGKVYSTVYVSNETWTKSFTLKASDFTTSMPVNDQLQVKNIITLPYDGTQVKMPTTWDMPEDTVISGSNVHTLPTDIPNSITDVKDLPIDVSKPNTDISTGWNWLDNILNKILNAIRAISTSIANSFSSAKDFVVSLFIPAEFHSFDFSPLYVKASEKFPFCIPFDLINQLKTFDADGQAPVINIVFPPEVKALAGYSFTIDMGKFSVLASMCRFFTLFAFCFWLILISRDLIRG